MVSRRCSLGFQLHDMPPTLSNLSIPSRGEKQLHFLFVTGLYAICCQFVTWPRSLRGQGCAKLRSKLCFLQHRKAMARIRSRPCMVLRFPASSPSVALTQLHFHPVTDTLPLFENLPQKLFCSIFKYEPKSCLDISMSNTKCHLYAYLTDLEIE